MGWVCYPALDLINKVDVKSLLLLWFLFSCFYHFIITLLSLYYHGLYSIS